MNRIFNKLCHEIPELEGRVLCQEIPYALASLPKESDWDAYHFSYDSMVLISEGICEILRPALQANTELKVIVFTDSTLDRGHAGRDPVATIANRMCDRVRFLTVGGTTLCVKDKRFLELLWDLFVHAKSGLHKTAKIDSLWEAIGSGHTRRYIDLIYPPENRTLRNRREMRKQYLTEPRHEDAGPFVSALAGAQETFIRVGT